MKRLLSLLAFLMFFGSVVYAVPGFPMVISGQIYNEGSLDDFEVTLTNIRTGEDMIVHTDIYGYFQFNPLNMNLGVENGDEFAVSVENEEIIIDDFNYGTYAPYEIEFDLRGKICPKCPKDTTPYEDCDSCCAPIVCQKDTTPYEECDSCCTDTTPYEDCDSCCEECPLPAVDSFWIVLASILSAVGGAGVMFKFGNKKIFTGTRTGMKVYRGRNGELKIYHKHPGTRGYHSPETSHRAPETHPKGMLDVSGHYKKVDGEWRYE